MSDNVGTLRKVMDNYQSKVIHAQINLLLHIREIHEIDLTVNQISWIDDDIAYVDVKYPEWPTGSTRADEFRTEEPKSIPFLEALELLTVRLHNTIEYLGDIIDPHQNS